MPTALRLNAFGLDNLVLDPARPPRARPHDVHVRLRAASLNSRDLMALLGQYDPKMQLPRILGSDAAGEVIAVGPAVTRFKPGDRICTLFFQDWLDGEIQPLTGKSALGGPIDGVFATERVLPESGLIHAPAHLSFEEAATLPCAALTAWNALVEQGHLRAGQTVLVQGTGGVSLFALQIAKMMARPSSSPVPPTRSSIAPPRSHRGPRRVHSLGGRTPSITNPRRTGTSLPKSLTHNIGVDHVVEVGGQGTITKSLNAVRPAGHVHVIGVLSGPHAGSGIDVRSVLTKSCTSTASTSAVAPCSSA